MDTLINEQKSKNTPVFVDMTGSEEIKEAPWTKVCLPMLPGTNRLELARRLYDSNKSVERTALVVWAHFSGNGHTAPLRDNDIVQQMLSAGMDVDLNKAVNDVTQASGVYMSEVPWADDTVDIYLMNVEMLEHDTVDMLHTLNTGLEVACVKRVIMASPTLESTYRIVTRTLRRHGDKLNYPSSIVII